MKTAVYPLNSCKDKGSPSLSAGLLSSPFFQLLPDAHVVEISLLRLKFTAASVFASPKNLLQDLPAWQPHKFCTREGGKVGCCCQDVALSPLLCTGADAVESRGEGSRLGFSQAFLIAGTHECVRES